MATLDGRTAHHISTDATPLVSRVSIGTRPPSRVRSRHAPTQKKRRSTLEAVDVEIERVAWDSIVDRVNNRARRHFSIDMASPAALKQACRHMCFHTCLGMCLGMYSGVCLRHVFLRVSRHVLRHVFRRVFRHVLIQA